jgi:diaminopimelate decarboxylase
MEIKDLLSITDTFGSPIYVYDAEKISSQYKRLSNAMPLVAFLALKSIMQ